jgi:hypothetical protein
MIQIPVGNSPSTLSGSSLAWVVQAPGFKFPPFGKFAMKYNPFGQIHVNMTDQEITDWAEKQKEDTIEAIQQYPSSGLLSAVLGMKIAGGAEKKVAFAVLENGDIASPGIVPQELFGFSSSIRHYNGQHQRRLHFCLPNLPIPHTICVKVVVVVPKLAHQFR